MNRLRWPKLPPWVEVTLLWTLGLAVLILALCFSCGCASTPPPIEPYEIRVVEKLVPYYEPLPVPAFAMPDLPEYPEWPGPDVTEEQLKDYASKVAEVVTQREEILRAELEAALLWIDSLRSEAP